MSIIGLDIGYSAVKALRDDGQRVTFPSAVGVYSQGIFSMGEAPTDHITMGDETPWLVGDAAIARSSYKEMRRDADWIGSRMWSVLVCAALAKLHKGNAGVKIVTGLPLEHYRAMRKLAVNTLRGEHRFKTGEGHWQTITIEDVRVMTQPYGSFADVLLADSGKRYAQESYKAGRYGVLDIGGNTINALAVENMREMIEWTRGDGLGLLKALDQVARAIAEAHKGLNPKAHEVAGWLADGNTFPYHGQAQDLTPYKERYLGPLAEMAVSYVANTWPEPGRLGAIFITGGGALALGPAIKERLEQIGGYPPVAIPENPVFANVRGYLKYGRMTWE
jgi:hypothetical protein